MTEQTEVLRYIVGPVCTNCYLLVNHKTGELLVVDPGDQAQLIEKQIEKTGAKPVAILLTHGHFDHAGAAEELADKYQISIYAHEAERETLEDPGLNLCGMIGEHKVYHADIFVKDEEVLNLAGFSIRVFLHRGIPLADAAIILQMRRFFSAEIRCFRNLWEEPISQEEVHRI